MDVRLPTHLRMKESARVQIAEFEGSRSEGPSFVGTPRLFLLTAFAILICLRLPNVALRGRFLGEEGQFFFAYAWHMPWIRAALHPLGGYLNIVASGSTLLAKTLVSGSWLPLEDAPFVTEAIALFFQLMPAWLILSSRAAWLNRKWGVVAALVMLATPPLTEEVWLNSLHSQFHLAVCAALILNTETEAKLGSASFRNVLLFLGPLCGPASIVMLPFFILRSVLEKSWARWWQTLALTLGSVIQLTLFSASSIARSTPVRIDVLVSELFVRHFVLPFFGPTLALTYGDAVRNGYDSGEVPWGTLAASVLVFGGASVLALRRWREASTWLLFTGLALATVSYMAGIGAGTPLLIAAFGERYSFIPQVLFSLSLLAFAATSSGSRKRMAMAGCMLIVLVGALSFPFPMPIVAEGPDWRTEVAKWRDDPTHRLAIWPDFFSVDLAPTDAQCGHSGEADAEIDFCDKFWERQQLHFLKEIRKQ